MLPCPGRNFVSLPSGVVARVATTTVHVQLKPRTGPSRPAAAEMQIVVGSVGVRRVFLILRAGRATYDNTRCVCIAQFQFPRKTRMGAVQQLALHVMAVLESNWERLATTPGRGPATTNEHLPGSTAHLPSLECTWDGNRHF